MIVRSAISKEHTELHLTSIRDSLREDMKIKVAYVFI